MLQKFHCEHVLEKLGDFGYYQKWFIAGVMLPFSLLIALHSNTLHNELVPDHWCYVDILANFSYGEQHRLIRPRIKISEPISPSHRQQRTRIVLSQCEMYDIDYNEVVSGLEIMARNESSRANVPTKPCTDGWVYNRDSYKDSASMQYNFVCNRKDELKRADLVRQSASILLSPLYAMVVDRFGRKLGLALIVIVLLLSTISPIFTTNYYIFLVGQTLSGSTFPISLLILLILGVEFVTPPYRSTAVIYLGLGFHFGEWISFLVTKTLSHWVWVSILNALCVFPCVVILYRWVDESPQWLLSQGDSTNLKLIFEKINRHNSAKVDNDSLNSIVSKFTHFYDFKERQKRDTQNTVQLKPIRNLSQQVPTIPKLSFQFESNQSVNQHFEDDDCDDDEYLSRNGSFKIGTKFLNRLKLFIKRSTLFPLVILFSLILTTNQLTIDYLTKRRNKIENDILLDHFFISLAKMPVIVFTWYLVGQRMGRRWSNCTVMSINLMLLLSLLFDRWLTRFIWLNVALSTFGIFLAECSMIITILQSVELSPTRFRAIVVSLICSIGKLNTILILAAIESHKLRPLFTLYTKLSILSGMTLVSIVVASYVAETRNEFLPLGLLASEQLITNVHYWSLSKKKSDISPSNLFLSLSKWDINSNHQIMAGSSNKLEKFTDS